VNEILYFRARDGHMSAANTNSKNIAAFRRAVWEHYRKHGRHDLPWRQTKDPYKILVSEVMLQQTRVPRVLEKYKSFLKKFPTVNKLARAPFSEVLKEWSGLGYNRRAKYLHEAAKKLSAKKKLSGADFESLPGVGPYTENAVRVFAFNESHVLIETNIRTAIIHSFFKRNNIIHDRVLKRYAEKVAQGLNPREWHWALMDYGAHLKRSGVRNNHKSAHYTKQSKFEGSLRQRRGGILRLLQIGPLSDIQIPPRLNLGGSKERVDEALKGLSKDGLIKKQNGRWRIA